VREVTEVEPKVEYLLSRNGDFACGCEIGQYSPVLAQDVIDISHKIIVVAIQSIVVAVAALIRAVFFIRSSIN